MLSITITLSDTLTSEPLGDAFDPHASDAHPQQQLNRAGRLRERFQQLANQRDVLLQTRREFLIDINAQRLGLRESSPPADQCGRKQGGRDSHSLRALLTNRLLHDEP